MTKNLENIYRDDSTSQRLISPFHMEIQPMERLLLVNLEKNPDREYKGFEPQVFDDDVQGAGMLVIAYRNDGFVDVYHERQVNVEQMDYSIAHPRPRSASRRSSVRRRVSDLHRPFHGDHYRRLPGP